MPVPTSHRPAAQKVSAIPSAFSRLSLALVILLSLIASPSLLAQTGGDGAIEGSVLDPSGAAVPNATVTATNVGTGVQTTRPTSSGGLYDITPLIPGLYTITVKAAGFESYKQEKVDITAMHVSGLNITLKVGAQTDQVTVTDAPPQLETTNGTLGSTIQGAEYLELPLLVSGNQQRDITQFSNLLPGAQVGSRSSVVGGTETRLGEVYVDGIPLTTISQQGDNRPVFNVVPLEAIDQIQVITSGFAAEYQGAGLENYNLKSGTNKFHGTIADFIRNTVFDTWGFSAPWVTITNAAGVKGPQNSTPNSYGHVSKPADHQNELSISFGGPVMIPHLFSLKDKLFFQFTLDKVHAESAPVYGTDTLPTAQMRTGDFSQLLAANGGPGYNIYDPTTQASCTAHSTNGACRYQFGYGPGTVSGPAGNPVATGAPVNVIPTAELSPISQYMQKFLPSTINANLSGNYVGGIPTGYKNYIWGTRFDYDISDKQRLSFAATNGRRHAVPYTSGSANLPVPYLAATLSTVVGDFLDIQHTYTITSNLVNQFKAGYQYFGGPPTQNSTEGIAQYESAAIGITGLPAGQGSDQFPGNSFGTGTDAPTAWSQPDITSKTVSHTFVIIDNLEWTHGKHAITAGIQLEDLMENVSTNNSYSSPITYTWSPNDTTNLLLSGSTYSYASSAGFSYASYMLGAVDSSAVTLQPFSDIGDRYHPISPYLQDDFKITSKLTLNLGLRWDYIPSFRETLDRWSFLNATMTNPYTGNPGNFQFAGNYGGPGVSCGCHSPVSTYFKNFGPRVGFAYSADSKTVFRGGFAILYSHGGGTGGAGAVATGQTGFNDPVSYPANPASPTAAPAFYLNNSPAFQAAGLSNTNFGGPTATLPTIPPPSATSQLSTNLVGNFVNGSGAFVKSASGINYADPYYGDRTPTLYFWNFGFQRQLSQNITYTMNYAGSVSHFVAGSGSLRGLQSGQVNPKYWALGAGIYGAGLLNAAATPANIAAAQAIIPGCCASPYPGFAAAAATSTGAGFATIAQGLKWMPQYSGTTDTWGLYSANAAWNALEVSLAIRPTHGLTFNLNYTWDKELDDAGSIRSGYAIPGSLTLNGKSWAADRIDRSESILDLPQNMAAYGVYKLPFGKGAIGQDHLMVRALASGWELSGITTYSSGLPLFVTSSVCSATSYPNAGQCMPDVNPNFAGPIMAGKWGKGATALNLPTKSYFNGTFAGILGSACTSAMPFCNSNPLMIGDAARGGAYGLRGPANIRTTLGLRRAFDITEHVKFTFAVDCQNVLNQVTFGGGGGGTATSIGQSMNTATFGTLTTASADSRDFQFSGRISF